MISKKDKNRIKNLFDEISKDYDLMNNIMSFGMHPFIKRKAVSRIPVKINARILDICTGTGDMAINLAQKYPDSKIIALDFSEKMLEIAQKKAAKYKNIEFIQADATKLPFENDYFDICLISFGLRNLPDVKEALIEFKRVLKQDGCFSNLDLGKPNSIFNLLFKPYFFHIVPFLGKIIHGNHCPYKYLPESNIDFPSQKELAELLKELGFREIKNYDYAFGTMAQQIAKR
ncbi:MAG: bifunctional demethylmenaquinone methyltransferase/2-methoxy-6-polyprenyl-1,4-benzoquinol methylase UbiE [Candidatus Gastranaerophilaceae bacterium]|jgi:demethylmenaquinone methyltransferase/2-methoxy-6-polyprenyl-1,4-benzoquinol methylase